MMSRRLAFPVSPRRALSVPWHSWLAFAALAAAACHKPVAGAQCIEGQALCTDPTTVLACQAGSFVPAHCGGPGGCAMVDSHVTCDDSSAAVGDVCIMMGAVNRACSGDKTQSLVCDKGKFAPVQTCRGGCQIKGDDVTCDTTGAQKGDLCTAPGTLTCGPPETKTRLVCKDSKYAVERFCRGPKGCHPGDVACDEAVADVGDPCSVTGLIACSPDGSRELVCEGGAYAPGMTCKKGICKILSETKVECR